MIYEKFPEKATEIGGIDVIGVVSENGETAVIFSGAKTLKKYFDGRKKISLTMQISGMAEINSQKELVGKMCEILRRLTAGKWDIDGVLQPKCRVTDHPIPVVKNERYWIYKAGIEITFYTEEEI